MDELISCGLIDDDVFAQTGVSTYIPQRYNYQQFLNREEFAKIMSKCDLVITHGGTGAIVGAVKQQKKVIAIPRLKKYGEHVDDHQLQLVHQFEEMKLICACYEIENLAEAIEIVRTHQYQQYISNTNTIIKSIDEFIQML